ncbi:MAG: hypothetical protein KA978_30100, partial [Deltaproteobacteria bacterium]|nr:hypothetical protein [Deltaproteobacteria bacterium]
ERPSWRERAAEARARAEEWRTLRALVLRFGVEADQADDVAQEAALPLHRTSSVLERRGLVWGIAKNTAAQHLRANMVRLQALEEAAPLLCTRPANRVADDGRERRVVARAWVHDETSKSEESWFERGEGADWGHMPSVEDAGYRRVPCIDGRAR